MPVNGLPEKVVHGGVAHGLSSISTWYWLMPLGSETAFQRSVVDEVQAKGMLSFGSMIVGAGGPITSGVGLGVKVAVASGVAVGVGVSVGVGVAVASGVGVVVGVGVASGVAVGVAVGWATRTVTESGRLEEPSAARATAWITYSPGPPAVQAWLKWARFPSAGGPSRA